MCIIMLDVHNRVYEDIIDINAEIQRPERDIAPLVVVSMLLSIISI